MENKINLISKEKTTKQNRIWVRIASSCNNRCIFCLDSFAHNGTFTNEEQVKKKIKDGYKQGCENRVILSGGEASINPKFTEYIKYSKELGYDRVQTVTNGNMFCDIDFCKKVFDAGLEEVTFSFHGHNAMLHDYLVDTPGAFNKSLKGLLNIRKYYKKVILNVDIVVNKVNINYLPDIIKFFIKLGIYEYDILQIIPFGRGFTENKDKLFYKLSDHSDKLTETWKLSKIPGMYMWTNRFPPEAFEGFEDLIQDPRKLKSEVMGESLHVFSPFIETQGEKKPECYPKACNYCFQKQYCHDFIKTKKLQNIYDKGGPLESKNKDDYIVIEGEEFPSQVYEKYGAKKEDFLKYLKSQNKKLINVPKCLGGTGIYESYKDLEPNYKVDDYTKKYINYLYRKKSLRCRDCKYDNECEGIHINFIRSYSFLILNAIK